MWADSCIYLFDVVCYLLQVRYVNMYKGISRTHYKQEFDSTNLMRCWDECMKKSSYVSRRADVQTTNKKNYWKKRGIAMVPLKFTVGFVEKTYHQVGVCMFIIKISAVLFWVLEELGEISFHS